MKGNSNLINKIVKAQSWDFLGKSSTFYGKHDGLKLPFENLKKLPRRDFCMFVSTFNWSIFKRQGSIRLVEIQKNWEKKGDKWRIDSYDFENAFCDLFFEIDSNCTKMWCRGFIKALDVLFEGFSFLGSLYPLQKLWKVLKFAWHIRWSLISLCFSRTTYKYLL